MLHYDGLRLSRVGAGGNDRCRSLFLCKQSFWKKHRVFEVAGGNKERLERAYNKSTCTQGP